MDILNALTSAISSSTLCKLFAKSQDQAFGSIFRGPFTSEAQTMIWEVKKQGQKIGTEVERCCKTGKCDTAVMVNKNLT